MEVYTTCKTFYPLPTPTLKHSTIVEADITPWSKLCLLIQPVPSKEGCKNEHVLLPIFAILFPCFPKIPLCCKVGS
uniref:Uncharacterized protein n=1 Tax=Arundo donax TaxID=35708 RepID=A0A0A9CUQ0_ARUDO